MDLLVLVTVFVTALVTSIAVTPLVLRIASTYNLFDKPDGPTLGLNARKIHSKPIPRLGGISILLGYLVCFGIWHPQASIGSSLFCASLLIFSLGIVDDITPLSAKLRFILQCLITGFAVVASDLVIDHINIFSGYTLDLPWWIGLPFSIFIVVGAINALNMIDGLDGLAGGVSIISMTLLAYLYYFISHDFRTIAYLTLPIVGAVIGFLRYNTHPAKIFMGDSGSNWLGFIVGLHLLLILKLPVAQSIGLDSITLLSVLMCFAVPIIDSALVIVSRLRANLPVMAPDKRHFHHSLMHIGLSQSQSVSVIYFLCVVGGITGLAPILYPNHKLNWIPICGAIFVVSVIVVAFSLHSRLRGTVLKITSALVRNTSSETGTFRLIIRIWERINKYCLFLVLAVTPMFAGKIPEVMGYVTISTLALLLATSIFRSKSNDFLESFAIALACLSLIAANNQNILRIEIYGNVYPIQQLYNGLFMFLLVSSLSFLFVTVRRKHLILNSSDFLMLTFPFLLNLLPNELKIEYRIDTISLKTLIVFIAYRTLEKRRMQSRRHLKMAATIALLYLTAVAMMGLKIVY